MAKSSYRKGESGEAEPAPAQVIPVPTQEAFEWKTELTRELLESLVRSCAILSFRKDIALANGVKPDLFDWWLSEGMRDDAPELMKELSVRVQSVQGIQNLALVHEVQKVAARGEWQAAMLLLSKRSKEWSGKMDIPERDLAPPELSLKQREELMISALKNAKGNLRAALIESLKNPDQGMVEVLVEAGLRPKALPE